MERKKGWQGWGMRYREMVKAKGLTLAKVAEKMDMAESTLRSWTNANRSIKLHLFVRICEAAGLDPAVVLFAGQVDEDFLDIGEAWRHAQGHERESLILSAEAILARHGIARRRAL